MNHYKYQHLSVEYVADHVVEVRLNRPEKRNAMNTLLWQEVGFCFGSHIPLDSSCRCVLLTGAGKIFSAGIDLTEQTIFNAGSNSNRDEQSEMDPAKRAFGVIREGSSWQNAWKAINQCNKPVIAAVQKGCYGAALEMIAFCDIRMCTSDTIFQAPEIDVGLAADIGGNQMLPKIIGNDSLLRELQLSGRKLTAQDALTFGLVSRVVNGTEELRKQSLELAATIASKSPIATTGVKTMLNYARDHSVEDSLKFSLTWNSAMLQSKDVQVAGTSFVIKQKPKFNNAPSLLDKSKL